MVIKSYKFSTGILKSFEKGRKKKMKRKRKMKLEINIYSKCLMVGNFKNGLKTS